MSQKVANFYTVQYEHIKRYMVGWHTRLFQIPHSMFLPNISKNRLTSDKDIRKIIRVALVYETQCTRNQ